MTNYSVAKRRTSTSSAQVFQQWLYPKVIWRSAVVNNIWLVQLQYPPSSYPLEERAIRMYSVCLLCFEWNNCLVCRPAVKRWYLCQLRVMCWKTPRVPRLTRWWLKCAMKCPLYATRTAEKIRKLGASFHVNIRVRGLQQTSLWARSDSLSAYRRPEAEPLVRGRGGEEDTLKLEGFQPLDGEKRDKMLSFMCVLLIF